MAEMSFVTELKLTVEVSFVQLLTIMSTVKCTHHCSDLAVVVFSELYQVEAVVQQVFQAAMKAPLWFLRAEVLDCPDAKLHGCKHTHKMANN